MSTRLASELITDGRGGVVRAKGEMRWAEWADGNWHEVVEGIDFTSDRALRAGASKWALRRDVTATVRRVRLSPAEKAGGAPKRFRIRIAGPGLAAIPRPPRWVQLALFPLGLVHPPRMLRPAL